MFQIWLKESNELLNFDGTIHQTFKSLAKTLFTEERIEVKKSREEEKSKENN